MLTVFKGSKKVFFLVCVLTLLARWPGHDSEDIKNLRENLRSDQAVDFWGGFSSAFYGAIPNFYPGWETNLLLVHWFLASVGLYLLFYIQDKFLLKFDLLGALLTSLIMGLSTLITRDGTMLSCLVVALGILTTISRVKHLGYVPSGLLAFISLALFLVAASFRPWVSASIFFIFFFVITQLFELRLKKNTLAVLLIGIMFFSFVSIGLELASKRILSLKKSYPEQQVMLMDLSAFTCWSSNPIVVTKASSILGAFYAEEKIPDNFCNTFKPSNWVHLMKDDPISKSEKMFMLIQPENEETYKKVRDGWLQMVLHHPVDYVQSKAMFASQTMLGGDTRRIKFFQLVTHRENSQTFWTELAPSLVLLPLDLAVSSHLFSPAVVFFIILLLVICLQRMNLLSSSFESGLIYLVGFQGFWLMGTVLAYIGDTARFTYASGSISLLILRLLYLSHQKKAVT